MSSILKESKLKLYAMLTLFLALIAQLYLNDICIIFFGEPEMPDCLKK